VLYNLGRAQEEKGGHRAAAHTFFNAVGLILHWRPLEKDMPRLQSLMKKDAALPAEALKQSSSTGFNESLYPEFSGFYELMNNIGNACKYILAFAKSLKNDNRPQDAVEVLPIFYTILEGTLTPWIELIARLEKERAPQKPVPPYVAPLNAAQTNINQIKAVISGLKSGAVVTPETPVETGAIESVVNFMRNLTLTRTRGFFNSVEQIDISMLHDLRIDRACAIHIQIIMHKKIRRYLV